MAACLPAQERNARRDAHQLQLNAKLAWDVSKKHMCLHLGETFTSGQLLLGVAGGSVLEPARPKEGGTVRFAVTVLRGQTVRG